MSRRLRGNAVLRLIKRYLREGAAIEIDGFGSFRLEGEDVVFKSNGRIRVFLAYAEEDRRQVRRLCRALQDAGLEPWMDKEQLYPGQNWARAIERAVDVSDYFIGCFSRRSIAKFGHFQSELKYALDVAARTPLDDVFFVPVRLNQCDVPTEIRRKVQYVDLFPDWEQGVSRLVKAMHRHTAERNRRSKRSD